MRNYRKTTMHKHMLFPKNICTIIKSYQTLYSMKKSTSAEILQLYKCVIFVSSMQSLSSLDVSIKPS